MMKSLGLGGGGPVGSTITTDSSGAPAVSVKVADSGLNTWSYGDFPQNNTSPIVGDAGAADNDVLYTSGDVSNYSTHCIQNNSSVAIDVHITFDGTNYVGPAAVLLHDATAVGTLVTSIPAGDIAYLRQKVKKVRIDQAAAGTINAGEIVGFHGVE